MLYHYSASDKNGKITEDQLEADNLNQALQYLVAKGMRPLSVKPLRTSRSRFSKDINTTDKIFLTKYLSLMLKVGTDLLSAVNILIADFDKPAMKTFLLEIRENLTRGRPFYQTFAEHPKVFSVVFINLVKASETSGNLQQTFEDLSVSLQREAELKGKIRSALVYPIILSAMSVVIIGFLVTFALPKIATAFLQTDIKPPLFSRVVFTAGLFIGDNIVVLASILISVVGFATYFFWKNATGRRVMSQMLSRLPLVRKIYRDIAIQRFASTFSALMAAGLPIIHVATITAEVVGSEKFRTSLMRVANEGLAKGLTIGEAFRREEAFPKVVTNLVAISEKAGHLEEVLSTLADFYQSSVESSIHSLLSFLEPVLLLIMGILVAVIALAIIVPIYQLTGQF
ncbi:MAG: type II secretion system F family protein [Candidatus Liptonbacteria bacterium]|nr:type II secretion system F family protein [Candidatus Liptonbacteria bacterium]